MEQKGWAGKLENQKSFFRQGGTREIVLRIEALRRFQSVLSAHETELLEALKKDLNKPNLEAYVSELYFLSKELDLVCKQLKSWLKPTKVGNPLYFFPAKSWIKREPFGAALIIAPWNYPVQLAFAPLIAAIAAGNTVFLKPSEIAKATEQVILKIVNEAFPEKWVFCPTGGEQASKQLLGMEFQFVFFTGSTAIGRLVEKSLAGRLIPSVLELGGKSPCIIQRPKSLTKTVSRILTGKFFNAGQTCFCPDFIAVHQSQKDQLLKELDKQIQSRYPKGDLTDLAATPSESHAERVKSMRLDNARIYGEDSGCQVAPTVQLVERDSALLKEEIFGPLLPVVSYDTEQELIDILDPLDSSLALYLFSDDHEFTGRVADSFASGSVCINDTMKQGSNLALPFGGVGASGMGRYRGKWGVEQFSYPRAYTKRYFLPDPFEIRPPYGNAFASMRRFLKMRK